MKKFLLVYFIAVIVFAGLLFGFYNTVKVGFVNSEGRIVLPCRYDNIHIIGDVAFLCAEKGRKKYVFDKDGKLFFSFSRGKIDYAFGDIHFVINRNEIWDIKGNHIKLGDCKKVSFLSEHSYKKERRFLVCVYPGRKNRCDEENSLYNVYDIKNEKMLFPALSEIYPNMSRLGFIPVKIKGKYGLYDTEGNAVVKAEKEFQINDVFGDVYITQTMGITSLVRKSGEKVENSSFNNYYVIGDSLYLLKYSSYGLPMPADSDVLPPILNNKLSVYENGRIKECSYFLECVGDNFLVYKNKKYGLLGSDGHTILSPVYDTIYNYSDSERNIWAVRKGDKAGAVVEGDRVILPFKYYSLGYSPKNKCFIAENKPTKTSVTKKDMPYPGMPTESEADTKGVIDMKGKVIIPFRYSRIEKSGKYFFARSEREKRYDVYDEKGECVKKFSSVQEFELEENKILIPVYEYKNNERTELKDYKVTDTENLKEYARLRDWIAEKNSLSEEEKKKLSQCSVRMMWGLGFFITDNVFAFPKGGMEREADL